MGYREIRGLAERAEALESLEFYTTDDGLFAKVHCRIWDKMLDLNKQEATDLVAALNAAIAPVLAAEVFKVTQAIRTEIVTRFLSDVPAEEAP